VHALREMMDEYYRLTSHAPRSLRRRFVRWLLAE